MQQSQTGRKTWAWLGVILLLFIIISYFLVSKQPSEYPGYVSESSAPTGTKAFYTYLENENKAANKWEHAPALLAGEDKNQILFMIEPFFVPERAQLEEYMDYMEAGNTVLLWKNNPEGMFDVTTNPGMATIEEAITVTDQQGEEYKAFVHSYVRIQEKEADEVLLKDDAGVIALKRTFGEGSLIVVNSPNWLTNDYITDKDHVELISGLLQSEGQYSSLLVDEYIHGSGNKPSTVALYPKWLLVFALQLIVLTLLWLWYQGKRFGPIRVPREATVRFSNEQTTALAAWYQRGRRYQDSLKLQANYLKLLLQEKWGIPYRRTWQECTELITKRGSQLSGEEARAFTQGLESLLNKESVNKQEYLAWSGKMDQLRREVEEE
ncbi:hypothetical protein CIL05_16060 [Virgibacillus profundi]|uniref:DUF4350 domain-containing protein n=1 Tax=Virgibacillus profundi TaxID=2024555 RepID=A0A2A2IA49_9BACI|nr:DUF4350 domain-containing protein [Virgibacillus profundi]PAV28452.1 hypothetical protein CIL05_16060 [Virgibacillus profundi]PXY52625.1 DUF4350 domain-containing protein [Virgibacillus profundi]